MTRRWDWLVLAVVTLGVGPAALAADTVETWEVGATDVDLYFGLEGVGAAAAEQAVFGDIMLGYGLVPGVSAYLGATLSADGLLAGGAQHLHLGVFGTPVDTDHVDLDVFLDLGTGDEFEITPSLELNLDAAPDVTAWGAYLRLGVPVAGGKAAERDATLCVLFNPGAYVMVADDHQLLLEVDLRVFPDPATTPRSLDLGGVALGYNVVLSDAIELVTQVSVDLPQDDERVAFGVMTGFIATLPGAAPPQPAAR